MFRCCLAIVLCRLTLAQVVNFPNDEFAAKNVGKEVEPRIGIKYLGYFLSMLGSSVVGYQAVPIQTPAATTTPRTMTSLPLFSVFPADASPTPMATSPPPPVTAAATTTPYAPPPRASTLPTALPSSLPAGIITSFGPLPPPPASRPEPAPLVTTGSTLCGCLPVGVCVNTTSRTGISVRVVTKPPDGIACPAGLVYCCAPNLGSLCGLPNVVPGVSPGPGQANLGEFPWSAIILSNTDAYVGGGALIDGLHVLTAAHKVAAYGNGANLKIRLGDWDISSTSEPARYVEVKVKSITTHPKYDATSLKNDLSVITLESAVPVLTAPSPQINSICLPKDKEDFSKMRCWVAGWGKDQFTGSYQNIIKKVDLPTVSADDCQKRLRETRLGNSFILDSDTFLCAGGEANKDACTGDGGNALACEKNGQYYVAGITVGGVDCGLPNVPGLYVNMANYRTWVNSVIMPAGIDPRTKPNN